jgi:2-desacetyl-2-hydroxyethyl bacteriochlorophyllide A dehydrogenase
VSVCLPDKVRGIVFTEKGRAAWQEEPLPALAPGHVLCRTLYTGLTNGTERNFLCGGNYGGYSWPSRCGYQNVGTIIEVGPGVEGFEPGEVIFSGDFCQHRDYFSAPAGPEALIVKVTDGVDPRHAALFGMASVSTHDVRRAQVSLGEKALVIGAGPIGQFTAQAARLAGTEVAVLDVNAARLDIAAALGAHLTIRVEKNGSWGAVFDAGPFDVVFENSGAPVLDLVIGTGWDAGLLKTRGRIVIIAGRERVEYNFNAGQAREIAILHAGHFDRSDLALVARLATEGAMRFSPVISRVVKAADALSVYDTLRDDPSNLFGTVFDWR